MSFKIIIPARYSSRRLPGKPLKDLGGKTMIERVYLLAKDSNAEEVYIATDNKEILDCCNSFGAKTIMTKPKHLSGTDRIGEVIEILELNSDELIINLQGDEPFTRYEDINNLASFCKENKQFLIGTLFSDFSKNERIEDSNLVKIWVNENSEVINFSRDHNFFNNSNVIPALHLGIYAYKTGFIRQFVDWNLSPRERKEKLEQLRAIEKGVAIGALKSISDIHIGIDTQEDLDKARKIISND